MTEVDEQIARARATMARISEDEVDGTSSSEMPPVLRLPDKGRARVGVVMAAV